PARTGPDHGGGPAGSECRWLRPNPALLEGAVDDRLLDLLDRDRVVVDVEHARRLARRRADPARELGKVVGCVKRVDGVAPAVAVHQVVPVRDQVAERAARMAERDAAVHAARALVLELCLREQYDELLEVLDPLGDWALLRFDPLDLQVSA